MSTERERDEKERHKKRQSGINDTRELNMYISIAGRLPFMRLHRQANREEERKNNRGREEDARRSVDSYCHLLAERGIYEKMELKTEKSPPETYKSDLKRRRKKPSIMFNCMRAAFELIS